MRDSDAKVLLNFLTRMDMFIYPSEKSNVVSFITGYEVCARDKCGFTDAMSVKLEKKYKIKKYATGWSDQINRFAEKMGSDWMEGFHLIASEIIMERLSE